ncbi:TPA: DUF1642 domain-containing protein [Streptococcus suis]|nr:DUF1642 domain-containing protein [Streptococcus suis]
MNKQEFEKQAEALYTDVRSFLDNTFELIDQIHEPQRVVVPKEVAEWIKKCKDMNYSLRDAMKITELSTKLNVWFLKRGQDMFSYPNQEIFARAWLDGYEIEQGKLYVVTDGNKLYLKEFDELNAIIIIDDVVGAVDYAKRYEDKTKAQQAADELGWIVQEVE